MSLSMPEFSRGFFETLRDRMISFDRQFRDSHFEQRDFPNILYHYTDIDGLNGIVSSNKWRATHSSYLNDSKEIIYADEMICEFVQNRLDSQPQDEILVRTYKEMLGIASGPPSILRAWDYDVYLICFSRQGNLLDQWRAYGSDGAGYSLGINPSKLRNKIPGPIIFSNSVTDISFAQVIYDSAEQNHIIESIFDEAALIILDEAQNVTETDRERFCKLAARHLSSILFQTTLVFKHDAFRSEEEWRVILTRWGFNVFEGTDRNMYNQGPLRDVSYRTREWDQSLVPYIDVDFSERPSQIEPDEDLDAYEIEDFELIPLEHVILGPKHLGTKALQSLRMYLASKGYLDNRRDPALTIEISEIPYR